MYEQFDKRISEIVNMMMDTKSKDILVKHDDSMEIEANIKKINSKYIISLSSGMTLRVPMSMVNKYKFFEKYDSEDWKWFEDYEKLDLISELNNSEEPQLKEKLSNIFASSVILEAVFHECGHIIANHVDSTKLFKEAKGEIIIKNIDEQEKEMVADWHGVINHFWFLYSFIYGNKLKNGSSEEIINSLHKLTIFEWLSICYEFALFDRAAVPIVSNKSHPHPRIRLIACLEAMYEAIVDILDTKFSIEDSESVMIATQVFDRRAFTIVSSFCQLSGIDLFDKTWHDKNAIKQYVELRKYSGSIFNSDPNAHLEQLNSEDEKLFKKIIGQLTKNS